MRGISEGLRTGLMLAAGSILTVLLAVGVAFSAERETLDELLERRLMWITDHFPDLVWEGEELPAVEVVPQENLLGMAGVSDDRDIQAIYDHHMDTIWLRDDLDPMSLEASYILVHELVHYLQDLREPVVEGECLAEREPEAYEVQFRWQEEFGPYPPKTNWLFVIMISECGEEW